MKFRPLKTPITAFSSTRTCNRFGREILGLAWLWVIDSIHGIVVCWGGPGDQVSWVIDSIISYSRINALPITPIRFENKKDQEDNKI